MMWTSESQEQMLIGQHPVPFSNVTIECVVQRRKKSRHIALPCSFIRQEHTERLKLRNQSSVRRLSNGDQRNRAEPFFGVTKDPNELDHCNSDEL